jgi:hypothetical protein
MTIDTSGNVSIGDPIPSAALYVKNTHGGVDGFRVDMSDGTPSLRVTSNGWVAPRVLGPAGGAQICLFNGILAECASAAEYVPSVDTGQGFPKAADLVSIVPGVANPYQDAHGPFVVAKTTKACDPQLLGYIIDPAKGGNGIKKNEHYLPLAIYGYFPAKVTTENGAIKRGDPLTSSSTPGYAMKATGACRIIGYALEDARAKGTIQVFANTGETAVGQVASMQTQIEKQAAEIAKLKEQVEALQKSQAAQLAELQAQVEQLKQHAKNSQP